MEICVYTYMCIYIYIYTYVRVAHTSARAAAGCEALTQMLHEMLLITLLRVSSHNFNFATYKKEMRRARCS